MSDISIRLATRGDAVAIVAMLTNLVDEIGRKDQFFSTRETIIKYGFGAHPMFRCFIAERDNSNLGLALFFPVFSTNRACPGVYVQDLWISNKTRGQGIGRRLLTAVAKYSAAEWDSNYLSLTVYKDNLKAIEFYKRLGFDIGENDLPMSLENDGLLQLRSAS